MRFVVFGALAAVLAGCGKTTISPEGAAQQVVKLVSEQTGFRPTDVRCPSGVEAKPGVTFECDFTGPEGPYIAHMRVLTVQGERVHFFIRTRPINQTTGTITPNGAEQVIVNEVFRQTGFRPGDVRCPSGIPARVGVTFDCRFTGPEGPYVAHMRVTKVQGGRVDYLVRTRRAT